MELLSHIMVGGPLVYRPFSIIHLIPELRYGLAIRGPDLMPLPRCLVGSTLVRHRSSMNTKNRIDGCLSINLWLAYRACGRGILTPSARSTAEMTVARGLVAQKSFTVVAACANW